MNTPRALRPRRIRPGLYELTFPTVEGERVTFTIERIEPGDTAYASDVDLWAVHVNGDYGEPVWSTLKDAHAYVVTTCWYRHPEYGICAR